MQHPITVPHRPRLVLRAVALDETELDAVVETEMDVTQVDGAPTMEDA